MPSRKRSLSFQSTAATANMMIVSKIGVGQTVTPGGVGTVPSG